ncbi:MAG: hypothetical protein IID40_09270, partial [Planctomycetes bacterium]|nr:hypothetical protein [Planctomycetota bacterium]
LQTQSQITARQERIEAASRRVVEERDHLARSQERADAQGRRREALTAEFTEHQQQAGELESQIAEQSATIERLLTDDHAQAAALAQAQALLEDEKAGVIELLRRTSELHNEITKLETHQDSLEGQHGRLSQRDAQIADELRALLQRKSELEARREEIESLIEAEMARLEEKKREAERISGLRSDLARELIAAKEMRSGLASRQQLLSDLEQKMEGVGEGVRQLLADRADAPDDAALSSIEGMVADLFEADLIHALVVEAAVGDQDQYLVVRDTEAFLSNPERFTELAGRLTAICLDRLPPVVNARDFSGYPGFVASALEYVRFPEPLERLGRHLLGKTIIVDSLASARSLAAEDTDGHRFVTLEGQVLEADGRIVLGPASSRAGLISRKSELRDIAQQLVDFEHQIRVLADQLNRTEAEGAHLDEVQQELRGAIHESHTARVEANASLANVEEAVRRLTDEQPLIAGEVALIERQIAEARQRRERSHESLERIDEENRRREDQVEVHHRRIDEVVAERVRLQELLVDAKVLAGQLSEKRAATAETLSALRRELDAIEAAETEARREAEQSRHRVAEAEQAIVTGREELAALTVAGQQYEAESLVLRRRREMLRVETEELATVTKSTRAELEQAETRLHEAQLALQEATVRRDELATRVREEIDIDLADRYENYDHAERDWEQVQDEIKELRAKIDRLGNVNLDAITELEELERRQQFLTGQRDDLHDAAGQLTRLIKQLDEQSVQRFTESFEKIRSNFHELFRKLFGGGKADIILEDPDDILECGIEIMARPPGKELQSITLLSGGEKTLTAIALLMSVFQSRPAPFALLDEVDAALDEANNDRFNRLLLEFVEHAQFIVITHSKRTMTIADQMYGITMQEPGISTRVSVTFDQPTRRETPAVA